jgi:hypothetical protein
MIFNFKKKMECGKTCSQDFEKEIIKLVPSAIGSVNFHVTILHSQPHEIEVAFYDQGKHQSKQGTKIITQKFTHPLQKKFKGTIPTLTQLQNL